MEGGLKHSHVSRPQMACFSFCRMSVIIECVRLRVWIKRFPDQNRLMNGLSPLKPLARPVSASGSCF